MYSRKKDDDFYKEQLTENFGYSDDESDEMLGDGENHEFLWKAMEMFDEELSMEEFYKAMKKLNEYLGIDEDFDYGEEGRKYLNL